MKTNKKTSKVIPMSKKTELKLSAMAEKLKGRSLFAEKIERAKKSLSDVTELPIPVV